MRHHQATSPSSRAPWRAGLCAAIACAILLPAAAAVGPSAPIAEPNDNRHPAGQFADGVLTVHLELRPAVWSPDSRRPQAIPIYAFAEEGAAPQDPGPLLRVEEGWRIRASVRNLLPVTARVHGLHARPGKVDDFLKLAPGERREVEFTAGAPGTYFYWADTRDTGFPPPIRTDEDTELAGAFIVDARGAPHDDRIFVLNLWLTHFLTPEFREQLGINGRSWPETERLAARTGAPEHWRVINPTPSDHAMHLHGFFYQVTGMGDAEHFERFAAGQEQRVVTEHVDFGQTFDMTWVPERAGHWIFHCHMTGHMTPETALDLYGAEGPGVPPEHSHEEAGSGMYGLVLGITVTGDGGRKEAASSSAPAERLQLDVRERPASRYFPAGPGFFLEGVSKDVGAVGPPLVLTRGQPAEITVRNQCTQPTAVHWHGMELESYYDGVPGWSGADAQTAGEIAPGGSFVARMTPPRAGTFIYHTHWHDVAQLTSGLYGPLIVLEPGEKYDAAHDLALVVGRAGPSAFRDPLLLNGSAQPNELVWTAGVKYRLRLINMTPNDSYVILSLSRDHRPVQWRAVAKDGADLPASQALVKDASQALTVGETYDFEFTPEAGVYEIGVEVPANFPPAQKLTQFATALPAKP